MSELAHWDSFYVIVGSAAGALIGLQFVVLFGVGAAALLLLFIGIHNAWDGVTYHVFVNKPDVNKDGR